MISNTYYYHKLRCIKCIAVRIHCHNCCKRGPRQRELTLRHTNSTNPKNATNEMIARQKATLAPKLVGGIVNSTFPEGKLLFGITALRIISESGTQISRKSPKRTPSAHLCSNHVVASLAPDDVRLLSKIQTLWIMLSSSSACDCLPWVNLSKLQAGGKPST